MILHSIFLIIFNALFFVLGGSEHNVSVWISYGFIHFAYLMLLLTPKLTREVKSTGVLGLSIYGISSTYFLIELITGVIFILVAPDNFRAALVVQLCIAGLYSIILVSHLIANERTADAVEKRQAQIEHVKNASVKLKLLIERINDKQAKKKVESVYDALHSSPIKTHPHLVQLETQILMSINELEDAVSVGNNESIISLAGALLSSVNERNARLKTLN
jgi:hypothetical protein